jgi:hypothetical protein
MSNAPSLNPTASPGTLAGMPLLTIDEILGTPLPARPGDEGNGSPAAQPTSPGVSAQSAPNLNALRLQRSAGAAALRGTVPMTVEGWSQITFNQGADLQTTRLQVTAGEPSGLFEQLRLTLNDLNGFLGAEARFLIGVRDKLVISPKDSLSWSLGAYGGVSVNPSGVSGLSFGMEGTVAYKHTINERISLNAWGQGNAGVTFPATGSATVQARFDFGAGASFKLRNTAQSPTLSLFPLSGFVAGAFGENGNSVNAAYTPYAEIRVPINLASIFIRGGANIPIYPQVSAPQLVIRAGFTF